MAEIKIVIQPLISRPPIEIQVKERPAININMTVPGPKGVEGPPGPPGEVTTQQLNDAIANINFPVTSVNGETGDIEISATDILTSEEKTVELKLSELSTQTAELGTEVETHKAETVSEIIVTTRDITLEGQQIVSGFSKIPKRIDILTGLTGSNAASIGNVSKNAQGCLYILTDAMAGGWGGQAIFIGSAGANRVVGQITINQNKTITITWSKTGTPPTGTASIRLIAHYHGGE